MKIPHLPWSAIVAGSGSGMAGFALMALATGAIHLGSAATCPLAGHHHTEITSACSQTSADPNGQHNLHSSPCSCCCPSAPVALTTAPNEAPEQLAPLKVTATAARPYLGCEDDTGLLPVAVALTATATDGPVNRTEDEAPRVLISEPTRFVGAGVATDDPAFAIAQSSAAQRALAGFAGLAGSSNLWSVGGSSASGSGSGGAGGGFAAHSRAAVYLNDAGSVAPAVLEALITGPSLAEGLTYRLNQLDQLGIVAVTSGTLTTSSGSIEPISLGAITGSNSASSSSSLTTPITPITMASVPEPASVVLSMVGLGLASLAARRCGSERRQSPA